MDQQEREARRGRRLRAARWAALGALVVLAGLTPFVAGAWAADPAFADPAFQRIWHRVDGPVADGKATRGYVWGPQPGAVKQEAYAEGVGGVRIVQYFDKSRMEINDPSADPNGPFYVTNGLLAVELITGRLQIGNHQFVQRYPAEIPLASDTNDPTAPTYASFRNLLGPAQARGGQALTDVLTRDGSTTDQPALGSDPQAVVAYYEPATQHNIPAAFWTYLHAPEPVYSGTNLITAPLSEPWFYSAGYPIAEAYWTHVTVAGQANTLVLVQPFQRRVLTYVPSAPAGFKVQVGNIGQHYYDWRYNDAGKPQPTATPPRAATATPLPSLGPTGLTIFAAASLQESFTAAGKAFRTANPSVSDVQINFGGSQALVAQLQQGAPADVFASADKTTMDHAVAAGVIDGDPQVLVRNALAVVLPNDNPGQITGLKDLARPGVKISLADPSVPVGNYTLQVLDKLSADPAFGSDFKQQVLDNVVTREDNVRLVLTRVQLGEVDAGIVYRTDAQAANANSGGTVPPVQTIAIPDRFNVPAIYFIAPVKGAPHAAAAQAWIQYILSDPGQAIMSQYGFLPPGAP